MTEAALPDPGIPMFAPAPGTLREMSRLALAGAGYAGAMKELIDHLIGVAEWKSFDPVVPSSVWEDEPLWFDNPVLRAHAGGMAEQLARLADMPAPAWCGKPDYFLDRRHFVGGTRAKPYLLITTPEAFSRRGLFCGPALQKLMEQRR